MMNGRKVIVVTPGFCAASMFTATREHLQDKWTPGVVDEFWLLLNKYPLPSVEENERALIFAATRFGYKTFDSGHDRGLAGSLNNFFGTVRQPPDTILVVVDGDSLTDDAGFDRALVEVVTSGQGVPVCALGIPETPSDDPHVTDIAGHRVFVHPSMMMTNIGAASLDFYAGHFEQPSSYWGGNEEYTYGLIKASGGHLGYLMDYREARPEWLEDHRDPHFTAYKWENYYHRFEGSFAEYLETL
jgi:hypothetical protein